MDENMDRRVEWRRRKLARDRRKKICIIVFSIIVVVGSAVAIILSLTGNKGGSGNKNNGNIQISENDPESLGESQPATEDPNADRTQAIALANKTAGMYDYDKAIEMVKGMGGYDSDTQLQQLVLGYEAKKGELVAWTDWNSVPHIFFHSLIYDSQKAFSSKTKDGYNQYMTTIDEFNKVIQSMYDKGYVLISLHDMVKESKDENGNTVFAVNDSLMLPPGKRPFVMSQDDVCFYHYMDGEGFATKLLIDEKTGRPTAEYKNDDGTVSYGDYELVPILNTFIDQHPDFSYRGRKAILAFTGYDGVLGYRTDPEYKDINSTHLVPDQVEFLKNNPDFDWDKEFALAKDVAAALKADGWEFASHTWGHIPSTSSMDSLASDMKKWEERVVPVIGPTDMILFAHGTDFGDWHRYSKDNERFQFFKQHGFNYFCNVDGTQYFVQIYDDYVRTGRRNVDGYRMWQQKATGHDWFSDLFDVDAVFDKARPTPVPDII